MEKQKSSSIINTVVVRVLAAVVLLFGANQALWAQSDAQPVLSNEQKAQLHEKAGKWVDALALDDAAKAAKVTGFVEQHLTAVYSWNKTHFYTDVPAGVNPRTGDRLSELDRKMIAQSAMPSSVHKTLMDSLHHYLTNEQVARILDGYTIGKVAFTLKGYQAIVPDLTEKETAVILSNLEQAREQAIDYKSMKSISAIFEIYKTKNEKYLNEHGRNWHQLFGDYVRKVKAEKKAREAAKKSGQQ